MAPFAEYCRILIVGAACLGIAHQSHYPLPSLKSYDMIVSFLGILGVVVKFQSMREKQQTSSSMLESSAQFIHTAVKENVTLAGCNSARSLPQRILHGQP
jgi:hypothetical protein